MATNIRKNVTKFQTRENQESGITLVALIVSIIVLLILATVSINLVINNGILDKAKYAVDKYSDEQIKEEIALLTQEMKMHQVLNGGSEEDALRSIFQSHDSNATVTKSGSVYEVTYMGKGFLLGSDLEYIERVDTNTDEWVFNQSTGTLTAYNGDLTTKRGNQEIGEIIIPNYYNGTRVTKIGMGIFTKNTNLTKLIISEGIEEIKEDAFFRCTNLRGNLEIPDTVISIENNAFEKCTFDGILKLGKNIRTIGDASFYQCENLRGDLIIPDTVTLIGSQAFRLCSSLNGVLKLSNNLTTIKSGAFSKCSSLTGDLIIPNSVTLIESEAFKECSSLNGTVKLSNNLTILNEEIFNQCNKLTGDIIIPNNITEIKGYALNRCDSINSIKFLNKDTVIDDANTTIYSNIKIIGYSESTAQAYANKYSRTFEMISGN